MEDWFDDVDLPRVSEVLLPDGWHSINVPSLTVNKLYQNFSFDEQVSEDPNGLMSHTQVVVGPLKNMLAVAVSDLG